MPNPKNTSRILNNPNIQVVISPTGKPTHLQIPWEVFLSLSEGKKETLEILSDPWWSKELPKRLKAFQNNPKRALDTSIFLNEYRAKRTKNNNS